MSLLNPCPRCGEEAKLFYGSLVDGFYNSNYAYVKCEKCGYMGEKISESEPLQFVEELAVHEWNCMAKGTKK